MRNYIYTVVAVVIGCLAMSGPTWGQRIFEIGSEPSPGTPTSLQYCNEYTISSVSLFGDYEKVSEKTGTAEVDGAGAPVVRIGIPWDEVAFLVYPGLGNPYASNPSQPLARCSVKMGCGSTPIEAFAVSDLICAQLVKYFETKMPLKSNNMRAVTVSQPGVQTQNKWEAMFIWWLNLGG